MKRPPFYATQPIFRTLASFWQLSSVWPHVLQTSSYIRKWRSAVRAIPDLPLGFNLLFDSFALFSMSLKWEFIGCFLRRSILLRRGGRLLIVKWLFGNGMNAVGDNDNRFRRDGADILTRAAADAEVKIRFRVMHVIPFLRIDGVSRADFRARAAVFMPSMHDAAIFHQIHRPNLR